jgi:hydrogenase-4 component F
VVARVLLSRRRTSSGMFAYSSIEHMGIITFAFGMGGRSRASPACCT